MANANAMIVEVVYAMPHEQALLTLTMMDDATVREAIQQSGLLTRYPAIDLSQQAVGIWGKRVSLETRLKAGDRVEIYRPLMRDPKMARRSLGK